MHLIDQELSGINQLGAIVGAISGYLGGKQSGQLCLTADWQIICGEKNCLQTEDRATVHENEKEKKTHPASDVISTSIFSREVSSSYCSSDVLVVLIINRLKFILSSSKHKITI